MLKKIAKFCSSMTFAIILLAILIVSCALGSFITQHQTLAWYTEQYSERVAAFIIALHLDDVFHSVWFLVLAGFLCLNLLFCNLMRIRPLVERVKKAGLPPASPETCVRIEGTKDPETVFRKMGFRKILRDRSGDGRERLFSAKNRIGLFGAWVVHLGILLLIIGFVLGQVTRREYTVYGVPGETKPVGDTGLSLSIDDFKVEMREDDTVSEYRARISVYPDGAPERGETREVTVNHPADLFGYRFYQNSTGYAATVRILKDGETIQENVLAAGEGIRVSDKPMLTVFLQAFYPDYVLTQEGPKTASGAMKNPAYLYSLYYGEEMLGMNVLLEGEEIRVDEYTVIFSNPEHYTLLQIKRDSFVWLAFLGGLIVLFGLFLAFYLQQESLMAIREEDGLWTLYGKSARGSVLFEERLELAAEECGGKKASAAADEEPSKEGKES